MLLLHCPTDWGREPLSAQNISVSSQRVKWSDGRPLNIQSTETYMTRFFAIGQQWGMSTNMVGTVGSHETSIQQGATRIRRLNGPATCSAKNMCYLVIELWTIFMAPQVILICNIPSDTPKQYHRSILTCYCQGEVKCMKSKIKMDEIQNVLSKWKCTDL